MSSFMQDERFNILLRESSGSTLKTNELAYISLDLLYKLPFTEVYSRNSALISPLIFFKSRDTIEVIRCDLGETIAELKGCEGVQHLKWLIPARLLCRSPYNSLHQEFDVILSTKGETSLLSNRKNLKKETNDAKIPSGTIPGNLGEVKWSSLQDEDTHSMDSFSKVFHDVEVVGLFTAYSRDLLDGYLLLTVFTVHVDGSIKKWLPYVPDTQIEAFKPIDKSVYIINEENLLLETSNSLHGGAVSLYTEKLLKGNSLLVLGYVDGDVAIMDTVEMTIINILHPSELNISTLSLNLDFEERYILFLDREMYSVEDCPTINSLKIEDIKALKLILPSRDTVIACTSANKLLKVNLRTNEYISYIGLPYGKLYCFYKGDTDFSCVSLDFNGNLLAFNLSNKNILYSRSLISSHINTLSSSLLHPTCIISGSNSGQLNIFDINLVNTRITQAKPDSWEGRASKEKATTRGKDDTYPNDPLLHLIRGNYLQVRRYKQMINSAITIMVHHPRIPCIVALGCVDGSIYLLFMEAENPSLHHLIPVTKLSHGLVDIKWLLVDGNILEEIDFKKIKDSFVQRLWKSVYCAKYTSLLVFYNQKENKFVTLNRNLKVSSLYQYMGGGAQIINGLFNTASVDHIKGSKGSDVRGCDTSTKERKFPNIGYRLVNVLSIRWIVENVVTSFSQVQESCCLCFYDYLYLYLFIYLPVADVENGAITFNLILPIIKLTLDGKPTSIAISNKQYNQIYRHQETSHQHLYSLSSNEIDQTFCINALQEFIAISTDTGRIYITSLMNLYKETKKSLENIIHLQFSKVKISPTGINLLKWAILWDDYTMDINFINGSNCTCTDDCAFILAASTTHGIKICQLKNGHLYNKSEMVLVEIHSIECIANFITWVEHNIPNHVKLLYGNLLHTL